MGGASPTRTTPTPSPGLAGIMAREDLPTDPIIARRRQLRERARRRTIFIAVSVGLVLVVLAGIGVASFFDRRRGEFADPSPDTRTGTGGRGNANNPAAPPRGLLASPSDTGNWTFKEMQAYLKSKGLNWTYRPGRGGVYLVDATGYETAKGWSKVEGLISLAESPLGWAEGVVLMEQRRDAEAARQAAGYTTIPAFNYHTWLFSGDDKMLAKIRKALGD